MFTRAVIVWMSGQYLPKPWFHDEIMHCKDGSHEVQLRYVNNHVFPLLNQTKVCEKGNVEWFGGELYWTIESLELNPLELLKLSTVVFIAISHPFGQMGAQCVVARDLCGPIIGFRGFQRLLDCEMSERVRNMFKLSVLRVSMWKMTALLRALTI